MLSQRSIFLIEQIQRFSVECELGIVDAVWKFPGLGMEVYFRVGGFGGGYVGDEVELLLGSAVVGG